MYHAELARGRLWETLERIDEELAEGVRAKGCRECGGRLDRGDYPRKPRGALAEFGRLHARRLSFCCAVEGCRRRATPPSVRFMGRRVYLGAVFVSLVAMLESGVTPWRAARLRAAYGVGVRTLDRWRGWWRETFPRTRFWEAARARFAAPPIALEELPRSLLSRFGGEVASRLVACLSFLSPLTTGPAVSARTAMVG